MTGVGVLILFGLSCMSFPCEGKVSAPTDGTSLTLAPGSTGRIVWSFDDDIHSFSTRIWTFAPSDGQPLVGLAKSYGDGDVKILTRLFEVAVEKPATLVLKNVNLTYNGTYQFSLAPVSGATFTDVDVFIAVAPTVSFSCSSPITVDEGDDVACVCRGQGGNPPADVTWYKDGNKIGGTGKKGQTLSLSDVDKTASGTYKCVAQSHTLTDEKSIEMIVYYAVPPIVISLKSTPENAVFGESVVITCEAIAVPLPSYTIIHNDTEIVSTHKTYIITVLEYNHAGSYECIATSILGNSSKIFSLFLSETRTANAPTTKNSGTRTADLEEANRSGTEWYIVVVTLLSGIIIGILLSYIVSCSCRKFRSRNPQSNPEPQTTEVDTTYQELDLSKMNKEDNYQSLRVNAASNEDNSTYTELNKTRDVENNYQSLT